MLKLLEKRKGNIFGQEFQKYLLANGIELFNCWEDTVRVLLNVINTVKNVLPSYLNRRTITKGKPFLLIHINPTHSIFVESHFINGRQVLREGSLHQVLWYLRYVCHVPEEQQDCLHRLHLLGIDCLLPDLADEEQKLLPDPVIGLHPLLLDQLVQELELGVAEFARRGSDDAVDIILDIFPLNKEII